MIAYQEIPDFDNILKASNSFIIDQGIAVFALVIFSVVIFGMMLIMFMMLRNQGRTFAVLIAQSKSIGDIDDFKIDLLKKADDIVEKSEQTKLASKAAIETSAKVLSDHTASIGKQETTIAKHTESVNLMSQEFNILKSTIDGLKDNLRDDVKKLLQEEGITLSEDAVNKVADIVMLRLDAKFIDLQSCIETAIKTATQETPKVEPESTVIEKPNPLKEKTEHEESNQSNSDTTG